MADGSERWQRSAVVVVLWPACCMLDRALTRLCVACSLCSTLLRCTALSRAVCVYIAGGSLCPILCVSVLCCVRCLSVCLSVRVCRSQLRLVCDSRDEELHLLLPGDRWPYCCSRAAEQRSVRVRMNGCCCGRGILRMVMSAHCRPQQ